MSPSVVTNDRNQTYDLITETINISTPKVKFMPQNDQCQEAKMFAIKLYKMNFVDTGHLINATKNEKENIIA